MAGGGASAGEPVGADEWAQRFEQQAQACAELGSPLYGRLLRLISSEVRSRGATWDVVATHDRLRFGQAGPLRLVGAAHRLALGGDAPAWAALLPSCGGRVPDSDDALLVAWRDLVGQHGRQLVAGLDREVQTNEVGRAAALALGIAETRYPEVRLVEIGCSGGLNLRLDRFSVDLGGIVLGDAASPVELRPEIHGHLGGLRHHGLTLPRIDERVGIDPHPVDPTTDDGRLTLMSFIWPDQEQRFQRVAGAIDIAATTPAEILGSSGGDADTAATLARVLSRGGPTVVQHSIVWQYVPTDVRWRITEVMEDAGREASVTEPLAWLRHEPDDWDRRRVAVWLRTWPHGGDRLVAHADYHGRWISPV